MCALFLNIYLYIYGFMDRRMLESAGSTADHVETRSSVISRTPAWPALWPPPVAAHAPGVAHN